MKHANLDLPEGHVARMLCETLGCQYPIFGLSHSPDVVVAICRAGGVGIWAAARHLPEEISVIETSIRARVGPRTFGINLMLPSGLPEVGDRDLLEQTIPQAHRDFVDHLHKKYAVPRDGVRGERDRIVRSEALFRGQVTAALDGSADLFVTAIGGRTEAMTRARERGKRIVAMVGAPRHMRFVEEVEADFVVAQGYDAGGHTGTVGTFSLVPAIVERAGTTPVLAAGGIGTGSQVIAALGLGAAGVWLGTVWLASEEMNLATPLLQKLITAGCEDTVRTRASSGKPMRQIRTAWSDEWDEAAAPVPLGMPWQDLLVGSLEGAVTRHSVEPLLYTPAGQSVEWIRERSSVASIMDGLVDNAAETLLRFTSN